MADAQALEQVARDSPGMLAGFLILWVLAQGIIEILKGLVSTFAARRREAKDAPAKIERRALTELQAKQLTEIQTFQKEMARSLASASERLAEVAHAMERGERENREALLAHVALANAVQRLEMAAAEHGNEQAEARNFLRRLEEKMGRKVAGLQRE